MEKLKLENLLDGKEYSNDVENFYNQYNDFVTYIQSLLIKKEEAIIVISRTGNIIACLNTKDNHVNSIYMTNPDDLKNVYDMLKRDFASLFEEHFIHEYDRGVIPIPMISENILLEIDNYFCTESWIYDYYNKTYNRKIK